MYANQTPYLSGCGSVVRAVTSITRGLQFESSQQQNFIIYQLTVSCRKDEKIKKEVENGPLKTLSLPH